MSERGGGAATAAGMNFQSLGAAWYAVGILAEDEMAPPLGLAAGTRLEWLMSETGEPVDDLLVGTSSGGFIFVQAKNSISLGESPKSEFASVVDQFVRQFLANRDPGAKTRSWNRPLDPSLDRLVLLVGHASPSSIRDGLPALLEKIRSLAGRPLADAPTNAEEERALRVLRAHLETSWKAAAAQSPSSADELSFLSLVRVQTLDTRQDGSAEREARALLRGAVLEDPTSDAVAWDIVARQCGELAARRASTDRYGLVRALVERGVATRVPPSFRSDIEKLRAYTARSLVFLSDLSKIDAGAIQVKIQRESTQPLVDAALRSSLLVVGDPGAGKSGSLHDLAEEAGKHADCVVLLVDRLSARTIGELREELDLEHDVVEVLKQWTSTRPGLLVIDALDAAREERAAQTIRDLIRLVVPLGKRWHVVASIRKFDLRYGEGFKKLFLGTPPCAQFRDEEFSSIQHVNIPRLSDRELTQIGQQAPLLADLLSNAPGELRDLVRVPFNVRLVADLLADGVSSSELTPVRTQLELLERYWSHRVLGGDSAVGDERETILRAACEQMVATRSLHVGRAALAAFSPDVLKALLSAHVLAEWSDGAAGSKPNRYIIGFSHHVLYDYSIARLLMRGPSEQLLRRLQDQDFVLLARPSVGLHFQHLWTMHRPEFWKVTFDMLAAAATPKTVELIGPTVAAQGMAATSDFQPLYERFESGIEDNTPAEAFLGHLTGAVLTEQLPIVGSKAKPWCEVIERLSTHATQRSAFPLRALALAGVDQLAGALPEQATALGAGARAMLTFAIERLPDVPSMVSAWIRIVCRTFATEPNSSETLLRRLLDPVRMKERGFLEIPWLAREVEAVFRVSPSFGRDIYIASFLHQEESTATTRMGSGQLMPLASNRKQDFESALWSLSEVYPEFIKQAPVQATEALVPIVDDYVRRRHRFGHRETTRFEFLGKSLELRTDHSEIWDSGETYSHDDAVKILDAFEDRVRELSAANELSILEQVLAVLARSNPVAVVWRRMLKVAAGGGGEALTQLLVPLLTSSTVLTGYDTIVNVGRVLRARSQLLDVEDRKAIEHVILSLPSVLGDRERGEYLRAKLLGSFPRDGFALEEARALLDELRAKDQIPSNVPWAGGEIFSVQESEEDYLKELGVELEVPINRRIADQTKPLRQFNANPNRHPSLAEVEAFVPAVTELVATLNGAEAAGVDVTFKNYTWGHVAAACATAVHCEDLDAQSPAAQVLKGLLLTASKNHEPKFDQAQEQQFDRSPGWGSPAARIDAARGVMAFARLRGGASEDVREAARRLAFDEVAAVRYQVATRILYFYEADREFVWTLTAEMAGTESNGGVLLGFVGHTLRRLTSTNEDDGFRLLRQIFDRVPWKAERDEVHRQIVSTIAELFVYRGNANAAATVREVVASSALEPRPAEDMLFALRKPLTHGGDKDRAVRQRAIGVYLDLLRVVEPALRKIEGEARAEGKWTDASQQRAQALASALQDLCMQVYFASGAFETKKRAHSDSNDEDDAPNDDESERFYVEADALITELTRVTLAPAAHKVIETLAFYIPLDPERVFVRIAECVRNSRAAGYQFESLAASLIVTVVERYLADYRYIFRDNERCRRDLLELLDTFVEAGWPSARKLTYKLDEIFR
jgi:hypothetical protein